MLQWAVFLEGYATGTFQMVLIDGVILFIIWPLRPFLAPLKRPEVRGRFKALMGLDLTTDEETAMRVQAEKEKAARQAKREART